MSTNDGLDIFSLRGKVALVTGASGHLGAPITEALAQCGAEVLVNTRSMTSAQSLVHRLQAAGHAAEPAVFDVTNQNELERFWRKRMQARPLHIVVNNAYRGPVGDSSHTTPEDLIRCYDVGLVAAHRVLSLAKDNLLRAIKEAGDGSVINIASMYGIVSPDPRIYESSSSASSPGYGAVKAAMIQWTRYLACEFGPQGIRVNTISPGPFPTPTVQAESSAFVERLSDRVPLGRIGAPSELRGAVVFLASSASSYVTGANLVVDGGWTCW